MNYEKQLVRAAIQHSNMHAVTHSEAGTQQGEKSQYNPDTTGIICMGNSPSTVLRSRFALEYYMQVREPPRALLS